ncbi:MAG: HAMP domain-containing sensor histidine kinase [Patescibacteria group bacterium]|nr:HAMP domain-containing sensor histidine kinase [Patescibacteria group bacterium]
MPASKAPAKTGASSFFLKKNWQIIYAIILIVLIPITVVLNTFFVVNRFRKTVDVELQRTALIIGKMVNVTSVDLFGDQAALQKRLDDVASVLPEVKMLDVLAKEGEDFKVVASLYREGIGQPAHGNHNILAWYNQQAIAYLTKSGRSAAVDDTLTAEEVRLGDRYWGVVMPLTDRDGKETYLLSAKISLSVIDNLVSDNLFWSYLWLGITIFIVVLVLSSNTRLFEYAVLFRKLKEVDQMKDDFISMASHELRAPITAIRGYLSLFLEDAYGKLDDKPKGVLKTTFAIATHLAGLVEDLLDVSRIEQGRMSLSLEKVSPEELIAEIVEQLHFEAERKGLTFEFRKPEKPLPLIEVDKSRLRQVLINLCSNAIKYTPQGSVTVTAELKENAMVEIKITDTGLGMSAEAREKLFQKFYRVKTDLTRDIPGTGLGLWITKQIVEIMKGKIFVDSIEKVGTQASVVFPALKTAPAKEPGGAPTQPLGAAPEKPGTVPPVSPPSKPPTPPPSTLGEKTV